tara:strand:+ start:8495 stop:8686 length:192 start_codon:yes stop_codon:yes gene_type:complete
VKKHKTAREKAKSCKPPKDSIVVDASSSIRNTLTFSMSGSVSKERWEKIFGKKNNKKRTDKKT